MRTIYLDLCCLNRPFDEQYQPRVRLEAEAVLGIIELVRRGDLNWIGSDILDLQSSRNSNADRRLRVEALLRCAGSKTAAGERERQRGRELETMGFGAFDALHLASAEGAGVEVLLTTDDRLRRLATREKARLAVHVENPAKWYSEVVAP